jgi:uncharacterized membrane protein
MGTNAGLWVELGFILLTLFVVAPSMAAVIAYAAWKGWPKSFDREMYWTAFVSTGAVAALVIVYAMRIVVDGTWQHLVRLAGLGLGALLLGVAFGFAVGIFVRRANPLTNDPAE